MQRCGATRDLEAWSVDVPRTKSNSSSDPLEERDRDGLANATTVEREQPFWSSPGKDADRENTRKYLKSAAGRPSTVAALLGKNSTGIKESTFRPRRQRAS
jgi:hypothetical protein